MVFSERQIERETIFEGRVFKVYKDKVEVENGNLATREVVTHGGGAAIVAKAPSGKLLLVRQYRYPTGRALLEIPAGKIDAGEAPETTGFRELIEETGYRAGTFEYLTEAFPTPGFCSEKIYIYQAEDLVFEKQNLDENEFLNVEEYSIEQAVEMCIDGTIQDAKTIVGILTYAKIKGM